nr:dienelactone hydrolase family protein [uncultured Pseudodesulfovibrio sp.]
MKHINVMGCWVGISLLLLVHVAGCTRSDVIASMKLDATWSRLDSKGPRPAVGWVRGQSDVIHIYIEGDGVAYSTPTSPSLDPTPITPTALLLARMDDASAVAYVGRPCQYVFEDVCTKKCWTSGRFSQTVLQTENSLVDAAKKTTGAKRVVLIGFSGGGTVAALLAERRADVTALITVCGNLDHAVWTTMHGITPLYESLNPTDHTVRLSSLPQVHFLGETDTNINRKVTDAFVSRLSPDAPVTIRIVPGLAHGGKAWAKAWPELLNELRLDN